MTQAQEILLNALITLYQRGPREHNAGICINVRAIEIHKRNGEWRDELDLAVNQEMTRTYDRMGLDPAYPVPGGMDKYDEYADDELDMWDPEDDYGAARWQLLQDMIAYLTNIKEQK